MLACRRTPWSIALSALLLVACKGDGSEDTGANTTTNATPATPSSNTDDTPTTSATPTSTDDTGGTIGTSNVDATSNTASDPSTGTTQGLETVATTLTTDISTTTLSTGQGDTSTSLPDTDTTDTTDAGTTTLDDTTTDADTSTGEPVILDIDVVITADNAYSFAYGTIGNIAKFFGGVEAVTAGQIFNCGEGPEKYVVPGADAQNATHLYIIAWDDSAVTNGVLARFRRKDGGRRLRRGRVHRHQGLAGVRHRPQVQIGSGGPDPRRHQRVHRQVQRGQARPQHHQRRLGRRDRHPTSAPSRSARTTPPLTTAAPRPATSSRSSARWTCPPRPAGCGSTGTPNPASPFLFPGGQNPYHQFLLFRLAAELMPEPQ
jgi:hypothetical protein